MSKVTRAIKRLSAERALLAQKVARSGPVIAEHHARRMAEIDRKIADLGAAL